MLKKYITVLILLAVFLSVQGQKLPQLQEKGVKVPNDIKIDGQASEWGEFEAYNNATRIFYTIANDDKNIYLALKATEQDIIQKLTIGGVTLTVASTKGDLKKHAIAFTYRFVAKKGEVHYLNLNDRLEIARNITKSAGKADSLRKTLNDKLGEIVKTIEVLGAKSLDNPSALDKDNGIKVALHFDEKLNCVYELAIPLKDLSAAINKSGSFAYQVELNGATATGNTSIQPSASGRFLLIKIDNNPPVAWPNNPKYADMLYPTNFTAAYTLAK